MCVLSNISEDHGGCDGGDDMDERDVMSGLDSSFEFQTDEALFVRCETELLGLNPDSTYHFLAM